MTAASSPNPSYRGTLMELYAGSGAANDGARNNSTSARHDVSSLPVAANGGNGASTNAAAKNGNAPSPKGKKKMGSSYHFIPMVGKSRNRRAGSDSGSDDEGCARDVDNGRATATQPATSRHSSRYPHQQLRGEDGTRGGSEASGMDMLQDVFTNNVGAPISGGMKSEEEGGIDSGSGKSEPLHLSACPNDTNQRLGEDGESTGGPGKQAEPLHSAAVSETSSGDNPFSSRLGRRIWRQHQEQLGQRQQSEDAGEPDNEGTQQSSRQPLHLQNNPQQNEPTAQLSYRHLPSPDFLRLPPTMIQIQRASSSEAEWANVDDLERKVLQCHLDAESPHTTESPLMREEHTIARNNLSSSLLTSECFTRTIERDARLGLGMSLREYNGCVYVQECNSSGPAGKAGLLPGDRLLGLNGLPFLKGRLATDGATVSSHSGSQEVLKSVGNVLSAAKSPMALHVQRHNVRDREAILAVLRTLQKEYKERKMAITNGPGRVPRSPATSKPKGSIIHPFAKALSERNLIKKGKEEVAVTRQLRSFTERTRQWESKLSFRLRASDCTLRPLLDARDVEPTYYASFLTEDGECPPFFDYKFSKSLRAYAPSTPMIRDWRESHSGALPAPRVNRQLSREMAIMADLYAGLDENDADVQDLILGTRSRASSLASEGKGAAYPGVAGARPAAGDPSDIFVPLVGVRKALCVRILNSFLDNRNRTAFTIHCVDVESGREWYAPVRYYTDFKDLRSALMRVDKSIGDIPFPSLGGWGLGFTNEAKESAKTKEARRCQLEDFLRKVVAGVYRGRLHPHLAEVAVHLQSFVGCDTVVGEGSGTGILLSKQVAISESNYGKRDPDPKSEADHTAQMQLKRSIMRYCYRLFLLPSVEDVVNRFVTAAMEKVLAEGLGPSSHSSHQFEVSKEEATKDVEKIRSFIDQVAELILEGCHDDFVSISQRRDFAALADDAGGSVLENLFREAVREQTELEVYVPLRSTISKYLVYAWFNEDMEMKHKMKALAGKPQSYFRIPKEHRSRSDWKSVSRILQDGVGRSTLPCVKLRAVVDAAKEVSQLDSEERSVFPEASFFDGQVVPETKALGADDFLPIFIYCFVQAKIERPSALCELLSLMCPKSKMNGETGYYLASFQSALTYIHQLDLTEAENDLELIFDAA